MQDHNNIIDLLHITDQQMNTVIAVTAAMIPTTKITPTAIPTSLELLHDVFDDD